MPRGVRIGVTMNLGNYESTKLEVWDEDEDRTHDEMLNELREFVKEQIERVQEAAGLPPTPADRYTG
jgi:hypothetical protein